MRMRRAAIIGTLTSLALSALVGVYAYLFQSIPVNPRSLLAWPIYIFFFPAGIATFGVYGDNGMEAERFRCVVFFVILINGSLGALIGIATRWLYVNTRPGQPTHRAKP